MSAKVIKQGPRYHVVDSQTGKPVMNKEGNAADGGGRESRAFARTIAAGLDAAKASKEK